MKLLPTCCLSLLALTACSNYIYANIHETNAVIKIDPFTGKVTGLIDLSSLANEAKSRYPGSMEMNGIAYDPVSRRIYITGKMW
ncbi:MAG: glutaminyl-peptide cyclotransferase, partial [Chitinophagaceae bacterium]